MSVNLLCGLAVALSAPLAALLAPLDEDSTVVVGEGLEVTSGQMEMWVEGLGPLPGMDEEEFEKIAEDLTIPREAIERAWGTVLTVKRENLEEELRKLNEEIRDR